MAHAVRNLWEQGVLFFYDRQAQGAFEYLLVLGGISAAVVLAIATPLGSSVITSVLTGTCSAINKAINGVTC